MTWRPANKITFDNYRWAVGHTIEVAQRSAAGRFACGLLLGPFDPGFRAARQSLREGAGVNA